MLNYLASINLTYQDLFFILLGFVIAKVYGFWCQKKKADKTL